MNNDDEGLECQIFVGQATYIYSFIVCLLLINLKASLIDLFTNMAAILNLLDLRSIMGCPVGTCSVFMFAWAKRASLHISQKKGNHYYIQTQHNNLFLRKLKQKLARKERVYIYTEQIYKIVLMPSGHPIILKKPNKFNMAAISVKRSIATNSHSFGQFCFFLSRYMQQLHIASNSG